MKPTKVLICGTGAIGGFYGALLAKAGAEVSVLCRSDYEQVKLHGYQIESATLGSWNFQPAQIVRTADMYDGQADFVILCSKITPDVDRVGLIAAAVSESSSIVFIQNGVEVEQELLDAFPENEVISGLAFICSNRIAPGHIKHIAYGKLTLGSLNREESLSKAHRLIQAINQAGIESIYSDNIIASRWLKLLWNASFNPLSVLSDGLSTQAILSSQEALIRQIMQEVCEIAKARGYPLASDSIDINIQNTYTMPAYKTSMLLDYQSHKTMEMEVILGNCIKAADTEQIDCPTLKTLYALMQLKVMQTRL